MFDILDEAKTSLTGKDANVEDVIEAVTKAYQNKRAKDAEALYLATRNWTRETFREEAGKLIPENIYREIDLKLEQHEFSDLEILVGGFDQSGKAHVFAITSALRGIAEEVRHSRLPCYWKWQHRSNLHDVQPEVKPVRPQRERHSIMRLRLNISANKPLASAQAQICIFVEPDGSLTVLDDEKTIEKKLIPICQRLEPRKIDKNARESSNELPELEEFEKIEEPKKSSKWACSLG